MDYSSGQWRPYIGKWVDSLDCDIREIMGLLKSG